MEQLKKIKPNVLKIIQGVLITLTVMMMLFTLISLKNFNEHRGKGFLGHKFFVVLSNSMKPEFQAGDVIVVKRVNNESLVIGDIITFYSNDPGSFLVTHQIIEKEVIDGKVYFTTKGTNNDQPDNYPVVAENIIGKVQFDIPKLGYFFQFIKSPLGYILLIFLPFLAIVSYYGYQFYINYKKYRQEQNNEMEEKAKALEEEKRKNEEMLAKIKELEEKLVNHGNNG